MTAPTPDPATDRASVCVFAPSLFLTVTVETCRDLMGCDEIHLHPGGQGFWVARLLAELGCRPVLCAPLGGEAGRVLAAVVPAWGVEMQGVPTVTPTPCRIDDRRSGRRVPVARDRWGSLRRHDVDDLYGAVLRLSLETRQCVVTGRHPGDRLPIEFFSRLGSDLDRLGITAIGDLHGRELDAFLERGHLSVLKVSDEDLIKNGMIGSVSEGSVVEAVRKLAERAIDWIVVSRAHLGAIAAYEGCVVRAVPPVLEVVDPAGAGDSMTAALVAARMRGLGPDEAVRRGCAAGAANVTRHGLGSGSLALIEQIAEQVRIEQIGRVT